MFKCAQAGRVSSVISLALLALCGGLQCDGAGSNPSAHPATSASFNPALPASATEAPSLPAGSVNPTPGVAATGAFPLPGTPKLEDALSPLWARSNMNREPKDIALAEGLEQQAYALYKARKDAEAVPLYLQALGHYPAGRIYYKLGNSLSNVERLQDAIKAYDMAIELGVENQEVARYNIACAYSRLKQAEPAFAALQAAVSAGYVATDKLNSDPDLAFLRAQPDWPQRSAKLQGRAPLVGKLVKYEDRDIQQHYTLCPDQRVSKESTFGLDESCCGSTYYGKLLRRGDMYFAKWDKVCGYRGVKGRKHDFEGEGCQPYKGCSKALECEAAKSEDELTSVQELSSITREKESNTADPGTTIYVPKQKAPALCSKPVP